jgi:hypothetical protein
MNRFRLSAILQRLNSSARDERGAALIAVTILGVVLTSVVAVSTSNALHGYSLASANQRREAAFQAAEAGVQEYVSKVTDDSSYFLRFVHPAESTRRSATFVSVPAGGAWNGSLNWTYPTPNNKWRRLANGYEYNLELAPPPPGSVGIKIISTGRKAGTLTEWRKLEVVVRPASVADFSYVSNTDQVFSVGATTDGQIYTGIDTAGVPHNLTHLGNAYGSLYAEGQVLGMVPARLFNDATVYDSTTTPSIRTKVGQALNFNLFTNALVDIRTAASTGLFLNVLSVQGWRLTFHANQTITVEECWETWPWTGLADGGTDCSEVSGMEAVPMPANGAIYSGQSVLVRGTVNGRVTVASAADIIIGEDLLYNDVSEDVLGLIARDNVLIPTWASDNLTVSASLIAQTGSYRSKVDYLTRPGVDRLYRHIGSAASNVAGYMTMFNTRSYEYDAKLRLIPPPFFPTFGDEYTVVSFREVTS